MIKHQCLNHMHASIIGNDGDKQLEDAASTQRWRTEYLEKYCGRSSTVVPAPAVSQSSSIASSEKAITRIIVSDDVENMSVRSISSRRSGHSSDRNSSRPSSELVDSRGITRNMYRATSVRGASRRIVPMMIIITAMVLMPKSSMKITVWLNHLRMGLPSWQRISICMRRFWSHSHKPVRDTPPP